MQLTRITDPFTGQTFEGLMTESGNIIIPDTFSGTITLTPQHVLHDMAGDVISYLVPSITLNEAAEKLGVSKARVSKMLNNDQLTGYTASNRTYIMTASVDDYMRGRQHDRHCDAMADRDSD